MAKKNFGLDSLIQPTSSQKSEEKEKMVNSNMPLKKSQHTALRILALKRGITLKDLLTNIIDEFLSKSE